MDCSRAPTGGAAVAPPPHPQFPAGLRVLVVDDDRTCLKVIEQMLRNCLYEVTACTHAAGALSILRERKGAFDVVLSDVYMPDMDGFKLLEHIGLEMDLPVIMMSAEEGKDVVMKGVTHGACDYLIKPVSMESIKNIWQHVVRKKRNELKELDYYLGSVDENDKQKSSPDDSDNASSVNEGSCKSLKRRKEGKEEGEVDDRGDSSTLKKPRVVWSAELHRQFVTAVNKLGLEKAVPKKILELMDVPGLSRENVASHLQKYRLYLRKVSGPRHQSRFDVPCTGVTDGAFGSSNSLDGFDLQVLAISGQLSPQSLISMHAEPRRVANASMGLSAVDQVSSLNSDAHIVNSSRIRLSAGQLLNNKQMNLLCGISTNVESSQLGQSQPAMELYGNMDLQLTEGTSSFMNLPSSLGKTSSFRGGIINSHLNNSFFVEMAQQEQHFSLSQQNNHIPHDMPHQPLFRGQLLNGLMGEQTTMLSSIAGQQIVSNEISGHVSEKGGTTINRNMPIDGAYMNTSSYGAVPQAQFAEFQNSSITESTGSCFSVGGSLGASNQTLTDMFQEGLQVMGNIETFSNKTSLKEVENFVPNFDFFSELHQSKSLDWRLQNVNPYESAQHLGSKQSIIDSGSSNLVNQDFNATLIDDSRNRCIHTKEIISVRREIERKEGCIAQHNSTYVVENSVRVKAKTIPDPNREDIFFADNIVPKEVTSIIGRQGLGQGEAEFNFDGYPLD